MSAEQMRKAFERDWGQVDAEQGVHFIPELNTYGSELYAQHEYAQMKSSAWYYFQKGWASSRAAIEVDLQDLSRCFSPNDCGDWAMWLSDVKSLGTTRSA